jgi:hypothetical protein
MTVLFVDESKQPRYLLAATRVGEQHVPRLRKVLRSELKPGQRSIHFKKEHPRRRRELLSLYERQGLNTILIESNARYDLEARFECLEKLVKYALEAGVSRLVFERDDSVFKFDEASLYSLIRRQARAKHLGFEHFYRHEEPLLWIPDSIAWCANQGGDWSRRIADQSQTNSS